MKDFKLFATTPATENEEKTVLLMWDYFSENNFMEKFKIEKSSDNKVFKIIGTEIKIIQAKRTFSYLFIDKEIDSKESYYRVFLKRKNSFKKIIACSNVVKIVNEEINVRGSRKQLPQFELELG